MLAGPGSAMIAAPGSAINVEPGSAHIAGPDSGFVAAAVSHYKSTLLSMFIVIAYIIGITFTNFSQFQIFPKLGPRVVGSSNFEFFPNSKKSKLLGGVESRNH